MAACSGCRAECSVGALGVRHVLLGAVSTPARTGSDGEHRLAPVIHLVACGLPAPDTRPGCTSAIRDGCVLWVCLYSTWCRLACLGHTFYCSSHKHHAFKLVRIWPNHCGYALRALYADQP